MISGGGIKGLVGLGAVAELRRQGLLDGVKNVVATSSGTIVAVLLAMDRMEAGLATILGHEYESDIDLQNLQRGFGLDSGRVIARLLDKIVEPPDLTLGQLRADTGKNLCVCTTNVSRRRTEVLSADTHPDLRVSDAIRASCSVPLVFASHVIDGEWHCDGGVAANFPVQQALELFPGTRAIAICYAPAAAESDAAAANNPARPIDTFGDFLYGVFETFTNGSASQWAAAASPACLLVRLRPTCRALDFSIAPPERYKLFLEGVRQVRQFLKKEQ